MTSAAPGGRETSAPPRIGGGIGGTRAWIDRAIGYGVVPFLFGTPPLRAVTDRLAYLDDLGVDLLWLSPVNTSPPGDFGYAVVDHLAINPDYGSEADFRGLVDGAHRRGMRVIMDFVPNHTSSEHPFFRDALRHGERSPYFGYYDRDGDGTPTHYFHWTNLPNLNYDEPRVRAYMTEAMLHWVREFDVDGYRLDAAWGITRRRPDFWPELSRELRRGRPDVLLLAEASARDPYYASHGFDATYDWTDELGVWAWADAWAAAEEVAGRLLQAITNADGGGYPPGSLVVRSINTNDSPERFVAAHGVGLTRVAATLMLTLHGLPMIYTGDEVGARYHPYRDRTPIAWDDPDGLRLFYRRLIRLRRRLPALRSRGWRPFPELAAQNVLAYLRSAAGHPSVLVVLNPDRRARTVRIPVPEDAGLAGAGGRIHDVLNDEYPATAAGSLEVPMEANGSRVLVAEGEEGA